MKAEAGAADGCPRCGGRVFEAEKVQIIFNRRSISFLFLSLQFFLD